MAVHASLQTEIHSNIVANYSVPSIELGAWRTSSDGEHERDIVLCIRSDGAKNDLNVGRSILLAKFANKERLLSGVYSRGSNGF